MPIERLHLVSLAFMLVVYAIRVVWLLRFRLVTDRARAAGSGSTGAILAMTTAFRPRSMESTRRGFRQWVEFAVFHVGVAVMIAMSFVIPFAPQWLTPPVVALVILSQSLALMAGLARLVRRYRDPKLAAISSPDDYFALFIVDVLFVACILAALGVPVATELYFLLVALIIAFVPFSKISHYIYYPFARYFYGSYLGRRGILR
jgi:nitrate reductase gamma subunit